MSEATSRDLLKSLAAFGAYSFNKAHAVAYATTSYRQMWLKVRFPTEFFCALLANEDDDKKIPAYLREAKSFGLSIGSPDINRSSGTWSIGEGRTLLPPLSSVKGLGPKGTEELFMNRPFKSLSDLAERVNRKRINLRAIKALQAAGALRSFGEADLEETWSRCKPKERRSKWESQKSLEASA